VLCLGIVLARVVPPAADVPVRSAAPLLLAETSSAHLAEYRLELTRHEACLRCALLALPLQASVDDAAEARRQIGPPAGHGIAVIAEDPDHERVVVRRLVRDRASQRLIHHDPQRPDVGTTVQILAPRSLLRGHVRWRADDAACPRQREVVTRIDHLADAKVEDLADELALMVPVHVDVRRLQIAVDDALLVGNVEGLGDADEELDQRLRRDRALAPQPLVEPFTDEELEYEERRPVFGLPQVEDLDDARAADAPTRLGLVEEALERDFVLGDLGAHHLERDVAIDELVLGSPDSPARPCAEELHEPVAELD
jgi:hypothetical protein